jgi:uncharacterized membrane protein
MIIHWRIASGALVGVGVWIALALAGWVDDAQPLIAWNVGASVYLVLIWRLFLGADEAEVRQRAAKLDEKSGVIVMLVLLAIATSLAGIVAALIQFKGETAATRVLTTALAGLTLLSSWTVLQSLFTCHYAHRHFQALDADLPGFTAPGDAPRTYLDFIYLAICIGSTAQISDWSVPSTPLRNLVTVHAATSFFYNTAVLALGINILSGLLGH